MRTVWHAQSLSDGRGSLGIIKPWATNNQNDPGNQENHAPGMKPRPSFLFRDVPHITWERYRCLTTPEKAAPAPWVDLWLTSRARAHGPDHQEAPNRVSVPPGQTRPMLHFTPSTTCGKLVISISTTLTNSRIEILQPVSLRARMNFPLSLSLRIRQLRSCPRGQRGWLTGQMHPRPTWYRAQ